MDKSYTLRTGVISRAGKGRANNEDNFFFNGVSRSISHPNTPGLVKEQAGGSGIWAVCDGMGGQQAGEIASKMAVSGLKGCRRQLRSIKTPGQTDPFVQTCVQQLNSRVAQSAAHGKAGMGCTLALVVLHGGQLYAYNVGDSPVYCLQEGRLQKISQDHTLAAQKAGMGLPPQPQEEEWGRNVLVRYLGMPADEGKMVAHAAQPLPLQPGLRLLLCSDGLSGALPEPQMHSILACAAPMKEKLKLLVAGALEGGSEDDITCICLEIAR